MSSYSPMQGAWGTNRIYSAIYNRNFHQSMGSRFTPTMGSVYNDTTSYKRDGGQSAFFVGATAWPLMGPPEPIPLMWKNKCPIWIKQWLLNKEKLQASQSLVQEKLQKGHIEESFSPWNSPVFVIKKKSGKWCLLTDLRAVSAAIQPMGPHHPGLPSPNMVPLNRPLIIIDLQDCFYTIPLAQQDYPHFVFTIPSINFTEPSRRFQWKVLP